MDEVVEASLSEKHQAPYLTRQMSTFRKNQAPYLSRQIPKRFCDTFTGAATGAARYGSFVGNDFGLLVASYE
jgi:hypothetical protein